MAPYNERFDKLPEDTVKSSELKINISGFHVYLYGVDELSPQQSQNTVVLFHVHGRTRTYKNAELFAHQFLHQLRKKGDSKKGFVVATFDNRNHGERAVPHSLLLVFYKACSNYRITDRHQVYVRIDTEI